MRWYLKPRLMRIPDTVPPSTGSSAASTPTTCKKSAHHSCFWDLYWAQCSAHQHGRKACCCIWLPLKLQKLDTLDLGMQLFSCYAYIRLVHEVFSMQGAQLINTGAVKNAAAFFAFLTLLRASNAWWHREHGNIHIALLLPRTHKVAFLRGASTARLSECVADMDQI